MSWIKDEGNRKIIGFLSAGIAAVVGAAWTLFTFFYNPADPTIRPHLKVYSQKYIDQKSISIKNTGFGPAVIASSEFCREEVCNSSIEELFDLNVVWDSYKSLTKGASIPPGEQYTLVKLVLNEGQGKNLALLEEWQRQKSGIRVKISYEDMEGNKYGPLITTLN